MDLCAVELQITDDTEHAKRTLSESLLHGVVRVISSGESNEEAVCRGPRRGCADDDGCRAHGWVGGGKRRRCARLHRGGENGRAYVRRAAARGNTAQRLIPHHPGDVRLADGSRGDLGNEKTPRGWRAGLPCP